MGLIAVVVTFHPAALLGALLFAAGAFAITFVFSRHRSYTVRISLAVAAAWFLIALFSIQAVLGIGIGSIEVFQYSPGG